MIINVNETRTHKVQNETLNGLNVMVILESSVNNTDVPVTDFGTGVAFDPSAVQVEVTLKRDNKDITILRTNLGLIAAYNTILKSGALWRKGIILLQKDVGVKPIVCRSVFIDFGGHVQVSGDDELLITATVTRETFGTGVNSANSSVQIETNQSIGIEQWIPQFKNYAIQQQTNEDSVTIGDNLMRLAMLSFETDATKQIFTSASLSSDRLDWTANGQELILRHWNQFVSNSADGYLQGLATTVHPLYYPNTFMVHKDEELDKAKLKFTMKATNVLPSKNFICYTTYVTSKEILEKATRTQEKHWRRDADKVPLSVTGK